MYEKIKARFFEGIEKEAFQPWTEEETQIFLEEDIFGFEPLKELNQRDKEVIYSSTKQLLGWYLNREIYHELTSREVYFFATSQELPENVAKELRLPDFPFFFVSPYDPGRKEQFNKIVKSLTKAGIESLSIMKKKNLLSDPESWFAGYKSIGWTSDCLVGYGMRHLHEYGITDEHFLETIKRIQDATRKEKVNVFDVGGANGLALYDAKKLTDTIITHNLSPSVEPVMFPTDYLYTCPAERMPISLKENMDLILSNMAFVYMAGQHLALENILQSLSVGGEAHLSIEWGKQNEFVDSSSQRMAQQYRRMQELHEKGYIELEVKSSYKPHPLDFPAGEGKFYPPARVRIRKKKSLEGI